MENVKCEGCKFSGNCYQEECYAVIQVKCNDYEEVGKDDKLWLYKTNERWGNGKFYKQRL